MSEPRIVVNGYVLTPAQAMTVRVALLVHTQSMSEPDALGEDERGRATAAGYRDRGREVLRLMRKTT